MTSMEGAANDDGQLCCFSRLMEAFDSGARQRALNGQRLKGSIAPTRVFVPSKTRITV
jgi:hypothetical protein